MYTILGIFRGVHIICKVFRGVKTFSLTLGRVLKRFLKKSQKRTKLDKTIIFLGGQGRNFEVPPLKMVLKPFLNTHEVSLKLP